MRITYLAAVLGLFATPAIAEIEKPVAIDGTAASTVVVAPTYFSSNSSLPQSYLRFFNGSTSADSVFTVTIVGVPSGTTYGSGVSLTIPARASIQYVLSELVRRTGATPGTFLSGDTGYAVYIRNTDKTAGYAHVVFDPTNDLFENHSNCATPLNQQMASVNSEMVLTNVHTSLLGNNNYPSTIEIHNVASTAQTYTLKVYNGGFLSATGGANANAGKLTCTITGNAVAANSRKQISMATIEANPSCRIDSDQYYANIAVSTSAGTTPNASLAHLIRVVKFDGTTNMTQTCAINPVSVSAPVATTPTAYCGTILVPSPIGRISTPFIASVATNGRVRATGFTEYGGYYVGDYSIGQVSGTTVTVTSSDGLSAVGSVQNGTMSGSYANQYGVGSFSATTAACSN